MFSANADGAYVHAHTVVLGAPPRADCRRVCAMHFLRRLYSHLPLAVNSSLPQRPLFTPAFRSFRERHQRQATRRMAHTFLLLRL